MINGYLSTFGVEMDELDYKSQNLKNLFANIMGQIPQEQLNELIQASLQDVANVNEGKAIHPSKNQWGQIYKDDYVVMQNRMLHAISHLTLNERRLVLMLATIVRGSVESNPTQKIFTINADDFGEMFGISKKKQYEVLQEVSKSLHGKVFYFWDFDNNDKQAVSTKKGKRNEVGISWIGKATYKHGDGKVELLLIDDVIEMLCIFDQHNAFTKHKKAWISKLGAYGIVLLQQIIVADRSDNVYRDKGKVIDPYLRTVSYTIEFLRHKFDCIERYPNFADFKRYVIDKAIKDIHEHTPYQVRYEKITESRAVTGIKFIFQNTETAEQSKVETKQDIWLNFKMSDKQLTVFSDKLAAITGESPELIAKNLSDVCLQGRYIDVLKGLDFKPSAWYNDEEVRMMKATYQQQQTLKQYEIIKQKEHEEKIRLAAEQAEKEKQQALMQMGWFDAVMRFERMDETIQQAVINAYIQKLDSRAASAARFKYQTAKKLQVSVTATVIDEHQVFIDVLKLFT